MDQEINTLLQKGVIEETNHTRGEFLSNVFLFTKLMKPCYVHLRCRGHIVSGYINDTYLQQQLFNDALNSPNVCQSLFISLCLLINPEKSLGIPSQIATVLGFIINSFDITVSLTTEKKTSLLELCHKTMQSNQITILLLGN